MLADFESIVPDPRYDAAKGIATYFARGDGDELRRTWLHQIALPAFAEISQEHPTIRSGAVVAVEGYWSKPVMSDAVSVHLLLSELDSVDAEPWLHSACAHGLSHVGPYFNANFPSGTKRPELPHWFSERLVPLFGACCGDHVMEDEVSRCGELARISIEDGTPQLTATWELVRPWLDGVRPVGYLGAQEFAGAEGDQRRADFLDNEILPKVRRTFAEHPQLQSCTMLVAQYWDDNASDEVHLDFVCSELATPDLEAENALYPFEEDAINLPTLRRQPDLAVSRILVNYLAPVPLFAAYCREGATQDDDPYDVAAPYAIFRRLSAEGDVAVEVVGVMRRPWVDGMRVDFD
jgi:hypothetical protein